MSGSSLVVLLSSDLLYTLLVLDWLTKYSAAIQAVSAIAIAVLTLVLIRATRRYVILTSKIFEITERDSILRLRPRLSFAMGITHKNQERRLIVQVMMKNSGPNDAVLESAFVDLFCIRKSMFHFAKSDIRLDASLFREGEELVRNVEFDTSDLRFSDEHQHPDVCSWWPIVHAKFRDIVPLAEYESICTSNGSKSESMTPISRFMISPWRVKWYDVRVWLEQRKQKVLEKLHLNQ